MTDLEVAKAELKALADAAQARVDAASDAAELASLRRQIADAKAIASAEETHGPVGTRIARYDTDLGVVIVKRPNHLFYRQFTDAGKLDTNTCLTLVLRALVHPSREEFDRYAEEQPGIVIPLASLVAQLAGTRAAELSAKP